jgi:hypothetical protein
VSTSIGTVSGLATSIGVDAATLTSKLLVQALRQLTEGVSGLAQLSILFFQRPHRCQALLQSSVILIVGHTPSPRHWWDLIVPSISAIDSATD